MQQTHALLDAGNPVFGLYGRLLYGTGMRIMECARLRVKDVEFDEGAILIRESNGSKNRGCDIRTVQELLGHADVSTTMIYTHVLKIAGGVQSPLDLLSDTASKPALRTVAPG